MDSKTLRWLSNQSPIVKEPKWIKALGICSSILMLVAIIKIIKEIQKRKEGEGKEGEKIHWSLSPCNVSDMGS
jgi:hypothetical protein